MRWSRLSFAAAVFTVAAAIAAYAQGVVLPCYFVTALQCQQVSAANPLPATGTLTTAPIGVTTTQAKVTIASAGTYQQALALSTTRKGCTIQFALSNTATHIGYVFFGSAPADTTTSFTLTPGQALSCAAGDAMLTDAVQLTSSNNSDVFVVANQ